MSIVFINDHPFIVDRQDNVFTSGTLDAEVWKRFTDNFGELTVIGRGKKIINDNHNHKLSSSKDVTFDLFYNIKGGKDYFKYKKQIVNKLKTYILKTEFIVIRLPSSIGVIAADLCKKLNKKYFVEVVGCPFDSLWYYGGILSKLIAPFNANNNRRAIKNASAAVYVTKGYLQRRYPNPNAQINASNVIIEDFDESILNNHLDFIKGGKIQKTLGMIGNIELPYKGYEVLFKALKEVKGDYKLFIVGGGSPTWITKLIEKYSLHEKIVLRGRINNRDEMFKFLDHLDFYLQPSLTEGLPRGVIEAMARGCPVIASSVGGIPELIGEDKLYNPSDYKRLSNLITSHLNDEDELLRMSQANYLNAKAYTFENIKNRRYQFFKEIRSQIKN